MSRRRFHLQLTPLLDLLLIVIFAQYLDVQQQADRQTEAIAQESAQLTEELDRAKTVFEQKQLELQRQEDELNERAARVNQDMQDLIDQQQRAASLMGELFDVPADLIEQALKPLPADSPPRTAAQTAKLRQRFAELSEMRGAEVIEHLLSYDELRKRADIWTLRIESTGVIRLTAAGQDQNFRANTSEEFSTRLFDRYKSLAQPKGLVVLLVSYGDARADVRQAVLGGLPQAIRMMREDRLGQTQFEYAILGFVPDQSVQ